MKGCVGKGWNRPIRLAASRDGTRHPRERGPSSGAWGDVAVAPTAPGRAHPFPSGCRGDALPSCLQAMGRVQSRRFLTLPISPP